MVANSQHKAQRTQWVKERKGDVKKQTNKQIMWKFTLPVWFVYWPIDLVVHPSTAKQKQTKNYHV